MQTFLTFRSFAKVAAGLDMMRLGKQRVETLQILRALRHEADVVGNPWAYRMWEGYEEALVLYGLFITHEYRIVRKLKDSTWGQFAELASDYGMLRVPEMVKDQIPVQAVYPPWLTEDWILRSHRSALIRKAPAIYKQQFGTAPENMPYLWPVPDAEAPNGYRLFVSRADLDRVNRGERLLPRNIELVGNDGEVKVVT